MPDGFTLRVPSADGGKRVDVLLAEHSALSRSQARALADAGRVVLNGSAVKAARKVVVGDTLKVDIVLPPSISAAPESIPLSIVYQDGDLVVIDKPAGLVVHPGAGHRSGTLANALADLFPQIRAVGAAERPGIVHRLDKDTSGLMVVALTAHAHASLQSQISARTAARHYLALVHGRMEPREATVDAPVGRDVHDRKKMTTYGIAARPATTVYRVIEYLRGHTFLEARLGTGRTHQIRVHLSATGHPVVADQLYGGAEVAGLQRQFLHAHRLILRSPTTNELLDFQSPLPADLAVVLVQLGAEMDGLSGKTCRRDLP